MWYNYKLAVPFFYNGEEVVDPSLMEQSYWTGLGDNIAIDQTDLTAEIRIGLNNWTPNYRWFKWESENGLVYYYFANDYRISGPNYVIHLQLDAFSTFYEYVFANNQALSLDVLYEERTLSTNLIYQIGQDNISKISWIFDLHKDDLNIEYEEIAFYSSQQLFGISGALEINDGFYYYPYVPELMSNSEVSLSAGNNTNIVGLTYYNTNDETWNNVAGWSWYSIFQNGSNYELGVIALPLSMNELGSPTYTNQLQDWTGQNYNSSYAFYNNSATLFTFQTGTNILNANSAYTTFNFLKTQVYDWNVFLSPYLPASDTTSGYPPAGLWWLKIVPSSEGNNYVTLSGDILWNQNIIINETSIINYAAFAKANEPNVEFVCGWEEILFPYIRNFNFYVFAYGEQEQAISWSDFVTMSGLEENLITERFSLIWNYPSISLVLTSRNKRTNIGRPLVNLNLMTTMVSSSKGEWSTYQSEYLQVINNSQQLAQNAQTQTIADGVISGVGSLASGVIGALEGNWGSVVSAFTGALTTNVNMVESVQNTWLNYSNNYGAAKQYELNHSNTLTNGGTILTYPNNVLKMIRKRPTLFEREKMINRIIKYGYGFRRWCKLTNWRQKTNYNYLKISAGLDKIGALVPFTQSQIQLFITLMARGVIIWNPTAAWTGTGYVFSYWDYQQLVNLLETGTQFSTVAQGLLYGSVSGGEQIVSNIFSKANGLITLPNSYNTDSDAESF